MFAIQETHQLPDTMFTLSRVGDAAIVSLACPTIHEPQAKVMGRYLRQLIGEVGGRLVLEVAGVGRFNCSWINTLIELSRQCEKLGGRLFVLGIPPREQDLIRSTGLDRYLNLATTRAEAMRSFEGGGAAPWRLGVSRLLDMPSPQAA
ncbi:hypothetical protein PHYC_00786 [Phycisphaerales bacterium]|nr:hypothetical protein PHYC_00786 [Phycisphaerales bacterium]